MKKEVTMLLKDIRKHAIVAHGHCHVAGYNNDVKSFLTMIIEKTDKACKLMEKKI